MSCDGGGDVEKAQARILHAAAEIDIFKPQGIKSLIEPSQASPGISPDHQKCACRLFHFDWRAIGQAQIVATE